MHKKATKFLKGFILKKKATNFKFLKTLFLIFITIKFIENFLKLFVWKYLLTIFFEEMAHENEK